MDGTHEYYTLPIATAIHLVKEIINKDKVRSCYQHACAEQELRGIWGISDISHNERKRLNKGHWPETYGRTVLGLGRSEEEAWARAVQWIEQRECRKLPFNAQ